MDGVDIGAVDRWVLLNQRSAAALGRFAQVDRHFFAEAKYIAEHLAALVGSIPPA